MANTDYSAAVSGVYKGMILLGVVTLIEVGVSLFGKGHLGIDPSPYTWILVLVAIALIVLSLYKAYYIIYEFMHMGHEVQGLRMSVLLPCLLLVWAIIAFFHEGDAWKNRRDDIQERNNFEIQDTPSPQGMIYYHDWDNLG